MSLLKYAITAKNDPICILTSIERLRSLKPIKSEVKIKCEEELTGINSVMPCTKESNKISIIIKEVKLKDVFLMTM